jgi:hypothetical protein
VSSAAVVRLLVMTTTRAPTVRRLATAVGLALLLITGAARAAEMGGHGGGMGMGHGSGGFSHGGPPGQPGGGMRGGFAHGRTDSRFARHGFHERRFHDGVAIVPFGFGYAPYAGYYPFPPTAYDTYCNQLSPYYDPYVCWDYYGG